MARPSDLGNYSPTINSHIPTTIDNTIMYCANYPILIKLEPDGSRDYLGSFSFLKIC